MLNTIEGQVNNKLFPIISVQLIPANLKNKNIYFPKSLLMPWKTQDSDPTLTVVDLGGQGQQRVCRGRGWCVLIGQGLHMSLVAYIPGGQATKMRTLTTIFIEGNITVSLYFSIS